MNIAPVIAHLSMSHTQRTHFRSHVMKIKLAVMGKYKKEADEIKSQYRAVEAFFTRCDHMQICHE